MLRIPSIQRLRSQSASLTPQYATNFPHVLAQHSYLIVAAILLGTFACFASGLNNGPVAEDYSDRWEDLRGNGAGQLRPAFALISIGASRIAGTPYEAPAFHHLLVLLVHLAATFLVFLVGRRLTTSPVIPLVAALIFAIYPRHHEPVLWPAASMHTLMTMFALTSFYSYLRAREYQGNRRWLTLSVVSFAIGMMCSEAGAVVVGFILAYEFFWHPHTSGAPLVAYGRRLVRQVLPHGVVAGAYVGVLLLLRGAEITSAGSSNREYHLVLSPTQIKDLSGYFSYSLFMYVPLRTVDSAAVKLAMLAITVIVLGLLFYFGSRIIRFGLCWLGFAVLPYGLLVPFGNADRYLYLASIGLAFALAGAIDRLAWSRMLVDRRYRFAPLLLIALLLGSYGAASVSSIEVRAEEWEHSGQTIETILDQVQSDHPRVDADTTFYFVALPRHYGQVPVLHWGVHRALYHRYQMDEFPVYSTADPAIVTAVQGSTVTCCAAEDTFIYLYQDDALVEVSVRFGDPVVRSMLLGVPPPP